jgi:hypothetical protein
VTGKRGGALGAEEVVSAFWPVFPFQLPRDPFAEDLRPLCCYFFVK